MKWGSHLEAFRLQFEKTGVAAAPLKNRPELKRGDLPYLRAFDIAGAARQQGFAGANALLVSEIVHALWAVDLTDDKESDIAFIQALDAVTLNYYSEKSKQKT